MPALAFPATIAAKSTPPVNATEYTKRIRLPSTSGTANESAVPVKIVPIVRSPVKVGVKETDAGVGRKILLPGAAT